MGRGVGQGVRLLAERRCRADILWRQEEPVVGEVEALPAFKEAVEVAGIDILKPVVCLPELYIG